MVWGFMGGYNEQQQASDQHALSQLSLQEGQAKLRDDNLTYQVAQTQFQRQQQMWGIMRKVGEQMNAPNPLGQNKGADQVQQSGTEADKATFMLQKYATALMADGFFQEGAKTFEDMAKLQNSQAEMAIAHANVQKQAITSFQSRIAMIDPSDPNAQQEFQSALEETAKSTGMQMPLDPKTPFTADLQQRIRLIGQTALQQAEAQKNAAEAKKADAQASAEAEKVNVYKAQEYAYKAHGDYWEKYSGPGARPKVPTLTQLQTWVSQAAGADLQVDMTDPSQAQALRARSLEIASNARAMIIEGADPVDAVKRSVAEAKAGGTYSGMGSSDWQKQPGATMENAAPLPKNWDRLTLEQKNKVLDDNTWYNVNGQRVLWKADAQAAPGSKRKGRFFTEQGLRNEHLKVQQKNEREIHDFDVAEQVEENERSGKNKADDEAPATEEDE